MNPNDSLRRLFDEMCRDSPVEEVIVEWEFKARKDSEWIRFSPTRLRPAFFAECHYRHNPLPSEPEDPSTKLEELRTKLSALGINPDDPETTIKPLQDDLEELKTKYNRLCYTVHQIGYELIAIEKEV